MANTKRLRTTAYGVFINTTQVDSSFWILLDKTTEMKDTHYIIVMLSSEIHGKYMKRYGVLITFIFLTESKT